MASKGHFILLLFWAAVSGEYTQFTFQRCGNTIGGINIKGISVSPTPIEFPGDIHLSIDANLTRAISSSKMEVYMKRETFLGLEIPIPCLLNVGSCVYDNLCVMVDKMITEDWAGIMGGIGSQVKTMLNSVGVDPAQCPQPAQEIHIHDFVLHLPQVPSVLSWFAAGDYHINVKVTENSSGNEVMCIDMHTTIKQHKDEHSSGFLFG